MVFITLLKFVNNKYALYCSTLFLLRTRHLKCANCTCYELDTQGPIMARRPLTFDILSLRCILQKIRGHVATEFSFSKCEILAAIFTYKDRGLYRLSQTSLMKVINDNKIRR